MNYYSVKSEWTPTSEKLRLFAQHVRKQHGNSQGIQELSKVLGIHRNTVTNWVTGKSEPRIKMWIVIEQEARRLGFNPTNVR